MYLNVGGYTGWRLPTMVDTGTVGCNFSFSGGTDCGYNAQTRSGATVYSEMAILFFEELGNKSYCPPVVLCPGGGQPGWGLTNTGDFQNMQSEHYWSGLEYAPDPGRRAWFFYNGDGSQNRDSKDEALYALFVRPGDVLAAGTVPEPQGVALMLTALAGLVVVRRRRLR